MVESWFVTTHQSFNSLTFEFNLEPKCCGFQSLIPHLYGVGHLSIMTIYRGGKHSYKFFVIVNLLWCRTFMNCKSVFHRWCYCL